MRWGSWFHVPEPVLNAYARMRPRILAEQSRRAINELLAANGRMLKDAEQKRYVRDLDAEMDGTRVNDRPRRPTLGQLERMGLRIIRDPSEPSTEEVIKE